MLNESCLHQRFGLQAKRTPNNIAVSSNGKKYTYADLDSSSNKLAHELRSMGVGPDVLVALCIDRSAEIIVGMLAILKAGGAYVPIDPAYPASRIQLLLKDSNVSAVVTVKRVADCLGLGNLPLVYADEDKGLNGSPFCDAPPTVQVEDSNLAYIIYTSGSTGSPKGVMVEHRNVVRLFDQTEKWFRFSKDDIWTLFHSISFDFSVWEIWGALLYGGHLEIVPFEITRNPAEFLFFLQDKRITVLNQTPSAFQQLVIEDARRAKGSNFSLRLVIFGGEALNLKVLSPWIVRYGDDLPKLINMFGITETTVHVTYRPIRKQDLECPSVSPIGVPIPDLEVHILDKAGSPAKAGTIGDLYVAGAGVARGYLNFPELTRQRFICREDGNGGVIRLYNSGDRAIRMESGDLHYVGRSDDQIKVRGFRIEPNEVEACLAKHADVSNLVVTARDYGDGDVRLVAHVIPQFDLTLSTETTSRMREELMMKARCELPVHMRPSAYEFRKVLPVTSNGKIDREVLRAEAYTRIKDCQFQDQASTTCEQIVLAIWEEVLQRKGIGLSDDFFDLGGTSLALIRILSRINERFTVNITGGELNGTATICLMAACVGIQMRHLKSAESQAILDEWTGGKEPLKISCDIEKMVSQIWKEVLHLKTIRADDDFFELGGTSLALIRILGRVYEYFETSLTGAELEDSATIEHMVEHIIKCQKLNK